MTIKVFVRQIKKVRKEILALGADLVPIYKVFLKRGVSPIGLCICYSDDGDDPFCNIEFSRAVLDFDGDAVHEVIAHELLHTIRGSVGHGPLFQKYAAMMNEKYGLHIGTYSSQFLVRHEIEHGLYNYVVRCADCGCLVGYCRVADIIRSLVLAGDAGDFCCPECEGTHLSIDSELSVKSKEEMFQACVEKEKRMAMRRKISKSGGNKKFSGIVEEERSVADENTKRNHH